MFEGRLVYHFVAKKDYRHFPPKPTEIYYEPVLVIRYCVGHYEVISGKKWRNVIYPLVKSFINNN